jgi:hypothetical protein
MGVLYRAREVARHLNLDPILPQELTWEQANQINELYDVIIGAVKPCPRAAITLTLHPTRIENLVRSAQNKIPETLTLRGRPTYPFLGASVDLDIEHTITDCVLAADPEEIRQAAAAAGPERSIHLEWKGTESSTMSARHMPAGSAAKAAETPICLPLQAEGNEKHDATK